MLVFFGVLIGLIAVYLAIATIVQITSERRRERRRRKEREREAARRAADPVYRAQREAEETEERRRRLAEADEWRRRVEQRNEIANRLPQYRAALRAGANSSDDIVESAMMELQPAMAAHAYYLLPKPALTSMAIALAKDAAVLPEWFEKDVFDRFVIAVKLAHSDDLFARALADDKSFVLMHNRPPAPPMQTFNYGPPVRGFNRLHI